jgi:hypothetical protein
MTRTIPCSWDVVTPDCAGWADYPTETQDKALWLASTFLWAATGRRYGTCPVTVRPAQGRYEPWRYRAFPVWPGSEPYAGGPFLFAGQWFGSGVTSACCGNVCGVVLAGPVAAVAEVLVDGEVVSPAAYRVDIAQGAWLLVRTDGTCWPICQNFTAEADAVGTFEVTYDQGTPLPEALAIATGLLACEYAKALTPGQTCALPAKMTRLSRQGVEIEVAPPAPGEGRTGIKMVDDVITSLNPSGRKAPPMIMSPDLMPRDRVTSIYPGS